ncbi:MAG: DEAD/DEAH box helicase [Gammaproteobacteria bacterium]|nr:DEAD/DEAH box helicase [Gammaproteobacteria bacterium]
MADILNHFRLLIDTHSVSNLDRIDLPARAERSAAIPDTYRKGSPGRWLTQDTNLRGHLWLHQAKALAIAADGRNLVISTGTASGKSLVFQSAAFRTLDEDDEAAVMVFYPLKALSNDQLTSWRRAAKHAEFKKQDIVRIDGDILRPERARLLESARVVLLTPDICQAWLLNEVSNPLHRAFLARTKLVVIDEAHVLEGVFGSNFAFLFRRLCTARFLIQGKKKRSRLQVIAASATISSPDQHLNALTGLDFETVGEQDDGAPRHERSIFHLAAAERRESEVAEQIHGHLLERSTEGSFITFVDSRQGVERLVLRTGNDELVKPYRSGYEAADRSRIERALREGRLRGVVSTSALELGIDIPHFAVGLNIGVPGTRKSFLQRLGRVGRQRPGNFAIVAEPYAFSRFGSTLADYHEKSVEPSYLYLGNRFMQFAHARCLAEELEMLGVSARKDLPADVTWPEGFSEVFDFAYSAGPAARPREFDQINRIGGDQPHFNYPLRNVPEDAYKVVASRGGVMGPSQIAQLTIQQAIREAFPGAIYLHMAKGWRVHDWRTSSFDKTIRVRSTKSRTLPQPLIRTYVNFGLDREGIVEGRFRKGECGFLAECQLQVNERVEGFRELGERKLYRDLRQEKPWMTPKTRDFRTTGVVMRIDEGWFRRRGVKRLIATSLRDLMLREYSISAQDIDATATNISMIRDGQREMVSDALVLFDATHGTLRLSEPAYLNLDYLLDRLERSVSMAPTEDEGISLDMVTAFRNWLHHLEDEDSGVESTGDLEIGDDWVQVFDVGSIVARRDNQGALHDIEVIGHEFSVIDDRIQLFYRYDTGRPMKALASAESVESVGDEWTMVYLNRETGEILQSLNPEDD